MSEVCLVVELEVEPARLDEYVGIVTAHAARTVASEPGCLGFDVLRPREEGSRVILVERYVDDAAVEAHLGSERMAAYRELTGPMLRGRTLHRCDPA